MTNNPNLKASNSIEILGGSIRGCLILIPALLLAACQVPEKEASPDAGAPSTTDKGIGAYRLVTVNGNKVPTKVSHGGAELEVRSGTFSIRADGTCASTTTFLPPSGPEIVREVEAQYTRAEATLTMQWTGAGTTTGSIDGDAFTMNNEGMIFGYQKEPEAPARE